MGDVKVVSVFGIVPVGLECLGVVRVVSVKDGVVGVFGAVLIGLEGLGVVKDFPVRDADVGVFGVVLLSLESFGVVLVEVGGLDFVGVVPDV